MTIIKNPTAEQIAEALSIVERDTSNACCITGDRYAMTTYGTFVNMGNISVPKGHIQAIRYISTYGDSCGSVSYVLTGISMYPKQVIEHAGFTPVAANELPHHFPSMETIIHQN